MEVDHELRRRIIEEENCYYSKSLFYDEAEIAKRVKNLLNTKLDVDQKRLRDWIDRYCELKNISLSEEQRESVQGIAEQGFLF
jgi:exodeoxyribonuclease V alpha subunit